MNSTNVRSSIHEDTRNVVIATAATWAFVVASAAFEGVFSKFDPKSIAYFAVGITLYALATYRLDRGMHAFIQHFSRGTIIAAACLMVATLAATSFGHMPALAVFIAPLAAIACAAGVEKLAARPTKAPAKSPAGTRAAT